LPATLVDQRDLGFRFAVEAEDAALHRVLDLVSGLADPGEDHFLRIAARFQHAEQFAAGDDVEPRSRFGQQVQQSRGSIGLHRITHGVRDALEGAVVSVIAAQNRVR
jgi:hypothetical protein